MMIGNVMQIKMGQTLKVQQLFIKTLLKLISWFLLECWYSHQKMLLCEWAVHTFWSSDQTNFALNVPGHILQYIQVRILPEKSPQKSTFSVSNQCPSYKTTSSVSLALKVLCRVWVVAAIWHCLKNLHSILYSTTQGAKWCWARPTLGGLHANFSGYLGAEQ